jgi:hypothetical protein
MVMAPFVNKQEKTGSDARWTYSFRMGEKNKVSRSEAYVQEGCGRAMLLRQTPFVARVDELLELLESWIREIREKMCIHRF